MGNYETIYKDIHSPTVLIKCCLHNLFLLFSDIRDAKTLVLETNRRGPEHRNFPEHSSGPHRHAAVHSAGYFCWAASVGAPRCWWQRYVGWLKWHLCLFLMNDQRPLEFCLFVYWYAASLAGRVVDIYSKFDVIVSCYLYTFFMVLLAHGKMCLL